MTDDSTLNKEQYVEVINLIDQRLIKFERHNDNFLRQIDLKIDSFKMDLIDRLTVLEKLEFRYRVWVYTITTTIGFFLSYSLDLVDTVRTILRPVKP